MISRFAVVALGLTLALGTPVRAQAPQPSRRSIVHYNPYPYPGYYRHDPAHGYRNPGGVGRYNEYYRGAGDTLLTDPGRDPVRAATFDQGGGAPDRAEQLQAQQVGIARASALQQHIDNYARPYYGYGFGVGYFGGMN